VASSTPRISLSSGGVFFNALQNSYKKVVLSIAFNNLFVEQPRQQLVRWTTLLMHLKLLLTLFFYNRQSPTKTSATSSTAALSLSQSSSASASTTASLSTASPPNGTIPSFPSSETLIFVSQLFYNGQLVSTMTVTTTIPASIPATLTSLGIEFPAASSPTSVVDCPAVNDTLYVSNTSSTLQAFELFCSSTPTNPVINGSSDYWATLVRPIFNSMTRNSFEECINACASLNSRNPPSIGCFMVGYVQSSCSLYNT
jgi:hypothetical protein